MKIFDIAKSFSYELASKEAALTLFKDGVVVYPTDTLYGLGVNALNPLAVERLFKVKKRPATKPLPVMVSSVQMAKALAIIDKKREEFLRELWPGPYTFVFIKKSIVPAAITAGGRTVALRMPNHAFCESLLKDFGGPITTTSANISGEPSLASARDIAERFQKERSRPDLIIDAGFLSSEYPSTIIDLTTDVPSVLRVNPTTKDKLLEILKNLS